MGEILTVVLCCGAIGIFLSLFLLPEHEACQPVRKQGDK